MSMLVGNRQEIYANYTNTNKAVKTEKIGIHDKVSAGEETFEEYKTRIREEIDKIPFHFSHKKDTETLVISDEAYQAMKDNSEYEQWVFKHINENRSVDMSMMTNRSDYLSGSDYEYIGATVEECWGRSTNEWANAKHSSSVSVKKSQNKTTGSNKYDYTDIWEQVRLGRIRLQEERDENYFSHMDELAKMNQQMATNTYEKNLLYKG